MSPKAHSCSCLFSFPLSFSSSSWFFDGASSIIAVFKVFPHKASITNGSLSKGQLPSHPDTAHVPYRCREDPSLVLLLCNKENRSEQDFQRPECSWPLTRNSCAQWIHTLLFHCRKHPPVCSLVSSRENPVPASSVAQVSSTDLHTLLASAPPLSVCVGQSWRNTDLAALRTSCISQKRNWKWNLERFLILLSLHLLAEKATHF